MKSGTYTIQRFDRRLNGTIYEVFADNLTGFDDFVAKYGDTALPGTVIDIADYKAKYRLRNDGNWERFASYAANEEEAAALEEAAAEEILNELIPDDLIDGQDTEDGGASE